MKVQWFLSIGCAAILAGCQPTPRLEEEPSPLVQVTPTAAAIQSPIPVPTPDPARVAVGEEVAGLIADQPNINAGQITVTVTFQDGSYATGRVEHNYPAAIPGNIWIAAKVADQWELVHLGETSIPCQPLSEYQVPASLVEVCVNQSNGQVVSR